MKRKCEYCDSVIPNKVDACPYCGAKTIQSESAKKKGSSATPKTTTGQKILAIVLSVLFVAQTAVAAFLHPGFLKTDEIQTSILPVRYETELIWTAQRTDSALMSGSG